MTRQLGDVLATLQAEAERITDEAGRFRERVEALGVVIQRASACPSAMMWRGVALTALQVERAAPRVDLGELRRLVQEIIAAVYEAHGISRAKP